MTGIRAKLVITFIAISALFGITGIVLYGYSAAVAGSFNELNDRALPELIALRQMIIDSHVIYSRAVEFTIEDDQQELQDYLDEIQDAKDDYSESFATYSSIATVDGQPPVQIASVSTRWDTFVLDSDTLIGLVGNAEEDELDEAREVLELSQEDFVQNIDGIIEQQLTSSQTLKASVDSNQTLMFNLIVVTFVASVFFSLGVGVAVSHRITRPLVQLKNASIEVAKGNYDVSMSIRSKDEFGELASQFEKMKLDLKEKEKMQNDFINIASHELRTPVQPILGYAELALKGVVKPVEALGIIAVQGKRLKNLTNDILDVTRLESGRIKFAMERVSLNELISDVVESIKLSTYKQEVQLVSALNAPPGLDIYADPIRIGQVLNNIIGNAIKFTKKGEVQIKTRYLEKIQQIEISISDTGPGISQELLPRLFGKFVTNNLKSEQQQGTGLGLFISKAIVEAHEGSISARNNDTGQGATFTIQLPLYNIDIESQTAPIGKVKQIAIQ